MSVDPAPREHVDAKERFAGALWAAAAALALGLPPEVHPESGVLVALALAAALLLSPRPPRWTVIVAGILLAGFNLAVSLAPGSTLEVLTGFVAAAAAFHLGRRARAEQRRWLLWALALVGASLGLLAVAQRLGLMALDAAAAARLGLPEAAVARLAEGRPFATHVVPAALAGALLVAGFSVAAAFAGRLPGARRLAWSWVPIAAGLLLTASIGAFAGLVGGVLVAGSGLLGRWSRRRLLTALMVTVVAGGVLVALRPVSLFDLERPDNPLRLRLGNWRGAVLAGAEQPVAGTGLGSFGSLYPRFRREGDSQTRFAHNSWLQLGAEGGWPAIALMLAGATALWRRRRGLTEPVALWSLVGATAFALHNLVDFTAYLPGVAIPAAALAGLAFSPGEALPVGRGRWLRAGWMAALLLAVGAYWAMDAGSLQALEGARERMASDEVSEATGEALRASRLSPLNRRREVAAGTLLLEEGPFARSWLAQRIRRLIARDPDSPAPWHLLARWELGGGSPTKAWLAYRMAALRHPASPVLRGQIDQIEESLARAGLWHAGAAVSAPSEPPGRSVSMLEEWTGWDDLLLTVGLLLAGFVLWRWWRPGPAPASAVSLALLVLLAGFGEGGALPGARLARSLLLAAGVLAWLFPRRDRRLDLPLPGWTRAWGLVALLGWAGLATMLAPARQAARDGLLSLLAAVGVLLMSMALSRRLEAWNGVVLHLVAAAAGCQAVVWSLQRAGLVAGLEMSRLAPPLQVINPVRPAADFLHPGHLGTFLVAGGLALAGVSLAGRGPRRGVLAALLVAIGLAGGGRATVVALAAGGVVLVAGLVVGLISGKEPASRRLVWVVILLVACGLALGAFAVAWRMTHGDPYAWTRPRIWSACLGAIAERPWLGYGPGGFAPMAPAFAFEDPGAVARFSRVFHGPHSDLLGLFLALGIPGGLLASGMLAAAGRRLFRRARTAASMVTFGTMAALAAMGAHAAVDDLFADRPAMWVVAALLLGAAWGGARVEPAGGTVSRGWRAALAVGVLVAFVAGEALPWAADRAYRAGRTRLALGLEPRSPVYQLAVARESGANSPESLVEGLDHLQRALRERECDAAAWVERARLLSAACHEIISEEGICRAAGDAWSAALARRPRDVFARRGRARFRASLGRRGDAEDDLRLALETEPNYLAARIDLIRLLGEMGETVSAGRELTLLDQRAEQLVGVRPASPREQQLLRYSPASLAAARRAAAGGEAPPPEGMDGR